MGLTVTADWTRPEISILTLRGPLDSETHTLFDSELSRAMAERTRMLVLDMEGVDFLASSGIAVMLKARAFLARERATLALMNLQPHVRKVLEAIRLLPAFTVFQGREELDEYMVGMQSPPAGVPE